MISTLMLIITSLNILPHWSRLISSPSAYPYVTTINLIMLVLDLKNSEGSLLPLEEKVQATP